MRILITGATRGLGLATARALAARGAEVVVSGRDPAAVERSAALVGGHGVVLDLADLRSVADRARSLTAPGAVDAVVANAGLQVVPGPELTADGVEMTFAANVLGHVALLDTLLDGPRPPRRVVTVGSSTHDPATPTGGTPPPVETPDLAALSRGELATSGMQRYTTSKLHTTALADAYARERPGTHVSCLDPGLMPGTGLARDHGVVARALWSTLARTLTVLPFASTPVRSGEALARMVLDVPPACTTGGVLDHRLRPAARSECARDPAFGDAVLRAARDVLTGLDTTHRRP